ncbi:MAG: hypothetical protein V1678_00615 [Candidatus Aenigmatarchaeota archaeon]
MRHRGIIHIVLVNLIVFFALISIHELGHSAGGILSGCKLQKAVLMDANFVGPYTEMYCADMNYALMLFSSFFITASFSFLFLLLKPPTRNLFFISLGLSIVFSSLDVIIATNIQALIYPVASLGFIITALGEYFMASSAVKDSFPLDFIDIEKEIS